ncbi:MAG: hypothetical protein ABII06_17595 [Pseudomonadota bacterium]
MEEVINLAVPKNRKSEMIKSVSQEIHRALSEIRPPFDHQKDILKLGRYFHTSDRIKLTYQILRNARLTKTEQNRSPYREKGLVMQVGRNS